MFLFASRCFGIWFPLPPNSIPFIWTNNYLINMNYGPSNFWSNYDLIIAYNHNSYIIPPLQCMLDCYTSPPLHSSPLPASPRRTDPGTQFGALGEDAAAHAEVEGHQAGARAEAAEQRGVQGPEPHPGHTCEMEIFRRSGSKKGNHWNMMATYGY